MYSLFPSHMVDIYVLYGIAFLALSLALYLQPSADRVTLSFSNDLYLLSVFGFLHGMHELAVAWNLGHLPRSPGMNSLVAGLLFVSYLPLLEFGRRIVSLVTGFHLPLSWFVSLLVVALLGMALLADEPTEGIRLGSRFFIGLPGALLTGWGLLLFAQQRGVDVDNRKEVSWLWIAGVGFVFYSVLTGLVAKPASGLPIWLSNEEFLVLTDGIPVQVFRAICALVLTIGLVHVIRLSNLRLQQREHEMTLSMAELNATLEKKVAARTACLQQAKERLETEVSHRREAQKALTQTLEKLTVSKQRQEEWLAVSQQEQRRMATLLSAMNLGILFEDREGRVEFVNPAFLHLWGIPKRDQITGIQAREVLQHSTHRFARPSMASKHVLQVLDANEISERFEIDLYDGRVLTQLSYPVTNTDGSILGRLWLYEDITHERQTAQQLLFLAEHDPLTGLYNRHRFQNQLEQLFKTARRKPLRFAVFYFDLDEFKYINDTFGHSAGDTVLSRVAAEVSKLVRSCEVFARLGGDEFAVLSLLDENESPDALCTRIISAISSIPLRLRGTHIRLTTSLGVAIYPEHGKTAEELVAHADSAMYRAKEQGKHTWVVYDPRQDLSETALQRMTLGRLIERAIQTDAIEIHYQGVYRADGALSHVEALVRLHDYDHPGNLLMPGQFISRAERSGQIIEIDRWVLRHCIRTLAHHPAMPPIAVNISGKSFDQPTLPGYIQDLLEENSVAPDRLLIELTETEAVSDLKDAQRFIDAIRRLGCRVCMDDFGSGFATFVYLKYLDVDVLKIDGLFIRDLPNNQENQTFVRAMIDITRGLKKQAIAEFVEDRATAEMLFDLGVDLLQGYYFSRPTPDYRDLPGFSIDEGTEGQSIV